MRVSVPAVVASVISVIVASAEPAVAETTTPTPTPSEPTPTKAGRLSVALRVGMHHSDVDQDDVPGIEGRGARYELAFAYRVHRLLSFSLFAARSSYVAEDRSDLQVPGSTFDLDLTDLWLGARVIIHPHPRLFAGIGLVRLLHNGSDKSLAQEWSLGGSVFRDAAFDVHVFFTRATGKVYGTDEMTTWSLNVGVAIALDRK